MSDKVFEALLKNFEPFFNPLWTSTFFWRTSTLLLLLTIILAITFRKKIIRCFDYSRFKEHDRAIFARADAIVDEKRFGIFLDDLRCGHNYYSNQLLQLTMFINFFEEEGNQYLIRSLCMKSTALHDKLSELGAFLSVNFFWYPDNQTSSNVRLCMYPEFNVDRGGSGSEKERIFYDKHSKELTILVCDSEKKYKDYRKHIKTELQI